MRFRPFQSDSTGSANIRRITVVKSNANAGREVRRGSRDYRARTLGADREARRPASAYVIGPDAKTARLKSA